MKNWKKLISAGLALGLVLTSVPQSTSVVYAQEMAPYKMLLSSRSRKQCRMHRLQYRR